MKYFPVTPSDEYTVIPERMRYLYTEKILNSVFGIIKDEVSLSPKVRDIHGMFTEDKNLTHGTTRIMWLVFVDLRNSGIKPPKKDHEFAIIVLSTNWVRMENGLATPSSTLLPIGNESVVFMSAEDAKNYWNNWSSGMTSDGYVLSQKYERAWTNDEDGK